MACGNGHLEVVRLLLEKGADINSRNLFGETSLDIACYKGHLEIVRLLLERGADMGAQKAKQTPHQTSLHFACSASHFDVVQLLLEKGADKDAIDERGRTAKDYLRPDCSLSDCYPQPKSPKKEYEQAVAAADIAIAAREALAAPGAAAGGGLIPASTSVQTVFAPGASSASVAPPVSEPTADGTKTLG